MLKCRSLFILFYLYFVFGNLTGNIVVFAKIRFYLRGFFYSFCSIAANLYLEILKIYFFMLRIYFVLSAV